MGFFDGITTFFGGESTNTQQVEQKKKIIKEDNNVSIIPTQKGIIEETFESAKKEASDGYGRMIKNYDEEGATPAVLDGIATTVHLANKPLEAAEKYITKGAEMTKTDIEIVDNIVSDGIGKAGSGIAELGTGIVESAGSFFSTEKGSLSKSLSKVGDGIVNTGKGSANFLLGVCTGKGLFWGKDDKQKISPQNSKTQKPENKTPDTTDLKPVTKTDAEEVLAVFTPEGNENVNLLDALAEEAGVTITPKTQTKAQEDKVITPATSKTPIQSTDKFDTKIKPEIGEAPKVSKPEIAKPKIDKDEQYIENLLHRIDEKVKQQENATEIITSEQSEEPKHIQKDLEELLAEIEKLEATTKTTTTNDVAGSILELEEINTQKQTFRKAKSSKDEVEELLKEIEKIEATPKTTYTDDVNGNILKITTPQPAKNSKTEIEELLKELEKEN